MKKTKNILLILVLCLNFQANSQTNFTPEEWVNPIMGSDSKVTFSNGNTYPAIALPWGMNFWSPQTNDGEKYWQQLTWLNGK